MKDLVFTSCFAKDIRRFIAFKRSQGYAYRKLHNLQRLDRFAQDLPWASPHLNLVFFIAYASSLGSLKSSSRYPLLCALRTFSRYLHRHNPASQVYTQTIAKPKFEPGHLYSDQELGWLLTAAAQFKSKRYARSYSTFLSLLWSTGLRPGEAVNLKIEDFNSMAGTLFIRNGKLGKDRLLPLAASSVKALVLYLESHDHFSEGAEPTTLFLNSLGKPLLLDTAQHTFRRLLRKTGVTGHSHRSPRLHDFRHTFAVNRLSQWHWEGVDVNARLPHLSTYLGHVGIAETQLYLQTTPELMASAARRLCSQLNIARQDMEVCDV